MRHLFTLCLAMVCMLASAQTPYNPDSNDDGFISLSDLLDFLTVYGTNWSVDEVLGCTYSVSSNFDPLATLDDGSCAFPVDCEGVINGGAIEDECGVCDGDNSTCESSCSSCGYWDEFGVWQSGTFYNQHRALTWDGSPGGSGYSLPPISDANGLFESLHLGIAVDESAAGAPALYDISGMLLDFSGPTAGTTIFAVSPSGGNYQAVPSVANVSALELLPSESLLAAHVESEACAITTSLPQDNPGGSNNFSPQKWDFAFVRFQSNTNNIIVPSLTEGDRRYALRYHSGTTDMGESFDGFGSILFQFREWIYVEAGSPYAEGGILHDPENYFAQNSGGGWLEISGMPGNPGVPVVNLTGVGECQLCYAYNDVNPQAVDTSASWYENLESALNLPSSFYSLTGGICIGAIPEFQP